MVPATVSIDALDLRDASRADYERLHRFTSRLRLERMPDDPTAPLETAINAWRSPVDLMTTSTWVARSNPEAEIEGRGQLTVANTESNRHLAEFSVEVLPESRRRGLARRQLVPIAAATRAAQRSTLITRTVARIPGGAAFLERLGAARGLEVITYQLALAGVDRETLQRWRAAADDFDLGFWDGPYPEEDLEAAAALHEVMNTQPRGSLSVDDHRFTPEQLRQVERALFARGAGRWTFFARERATGKLAGFTDVVWTASAPHILHQVDTGVFPRYRGRGLARRLKAAMLERVMAERPEVQFVRTANADSNAAMLRINQEIGFEPYVSWTVWQVPLDDVDAYLGRAVPAG
jgi:mycothiol synthase